MLPLSLTSESGKKRQRAISIRGIIKKNSKEPMYKIDKKKKQRRLLSTAFCITNLDQ